MADEIVFREYRASDPIPEITEMLHLAYARLLAMGFRYLATHQDDETTLRRLARGTAFVAEKDGKIVGTITLYPPDPVSRCEFYKSTHCFGQFGVHPDLQAKGIGRELLRIVEERASSTGAKVLALDTAEEATHLRAWYDSLGYKFVQFVRWETVNYRSVILAKAFQGADA